MKTNKTNEVVTLSAFHHRGGSKHKLLFAYNERIKKLLLNFDFVRWTKTHKCFYLPNERDKLIKVQQTLESNGVELKFKNEVKSRFQADKIPSRSPLLDASNLKVKSSETSKVVIKNETLEKVEEFKRFMEISRMRPSTIKTYISFLFRFFSKFSDKSWNEISIKEIRQYNYEEFILRGLTYSAQNQFINSIKSFYNFHKGHNLNTSEFQRPKRSKFLPDVLTKQEVEKILSSIGNLKHKCLLSVIYGGGLRIGEALNLKLADVQVEENLIYIRDAKGSKDRRVPMSKMMIQLIHKYRLALNPKIFLFEGQGGGPYSSSSARNVLKKAVRKVGIKKNVRLHTLRHSYATHLLEAGVGLRYIQEILGHSNPKTTMIYTHVSGKKISEIRSPLDDLNI